MSDGDPPWAPARGAPPAIGAGAATTSAEGVAANGPAASSGAAARIGASDAAREVGASVEVVAAVGASADVVAAVGATGEGAAGGASEEVAAASTALEVAAAARGVPGAAVGARGEAGGAGQAEQAGQAWQPEQAEQAEQTEEARQAEKARQAEQAGQAWQPEQAEKSRQAEQAGSAGQAEYAGQAEQAGQARPAEYAEQAEQAGQAEQARPAEQARQGKQAGQAGRAAQGGARRAPDAASAPASGASADPGQPGDGRPEPLGGPDGRARRGPSPRRAGRRAGVLVVVGLGAIVAALLATRMRAQPPVGQPAPRAGSAGPTRPAVEAPRPPSIVDVPAAGVRLAGAVLDGAGAPVAGAEVTVEPERGAPDPALAGTTRPPSVRPRAGLDGGDASDGGAPGIAAGAAPDGPGPAVGAASAVTGDDGRFALGGLAPGRVRLHVRGPGLLAAELRMVPAPSDEVRVVVTRRVAIEGRVLDGDHPSAGVRVSARGEALGGTLETRTDATGGFAFAALPEGSYQVWAGQGAVAARAVRVVRAGGGPFAPVELHLEAGAIVVGRVLDRDEGTGVAAAVELRPVDGDEAPRHARSGDDGVFRVDGLPGGRWLADAYAPGYVSPGALELEAGRGVPELTLAPGGAVEGRVLDGDGRPLEGATVRAVLGGGAAGARTEGEQSEEAERDRLLRFAGRLAPSGPAAPAAPGGFEGDPSFEPRGELGVLRGPIPPIPPAGEPVRVATVVESPWLDDARASGPAGARAVALEGGLGEVPPLPVDPARASRFVTGPDGRYRVWGLPRGRAVIVASLPGRAEARAAAVEVRLGALVRNVDLVLTAGAFVAGRVTDQHGAPVAGAAVTAAVEGGRPLEALTGPDGRYRLGPLVGAARVHASAYGHDEVARAVELPPGRGPVAAEVAVDLVLAVADAVVSGVVEDDDGVAVAGADVEVEGGASARRRAATGRDGAFRIEQLPPTPVRLRVTHPSYPPLEAAATPGAPAALRLRRGGVVEGALLDDARGAVLPGVTLRAIGPAGGRAEATTDAAGRWRLGPLEAGRWTLEVKQPGFLPARRELDVPVARYAGGTSLRDVRIDLARGALLGGTVRDRRGNRVVQARVVARGPDGAVAEGVTDSVGEFRLRDCPTGRVQLGAERGEERGGIEVTARGGDELLGLTIELR